MKQLIGFKLVKIQNLLKKKREEKKGHIQNQIKHIMSNTMIIYESLKLTQNKGFLSINKITETLPLLTLK